MPSIKSRKIKILLTIILAVSVGFLIFPTYKTFASDNPELRFSELKPRLSIEIPGLKFSDLLPPKKAGDPLYISWIGEYIAAVYSYVVGIASLLAVAMIMWGGMKWIFAGGDSGKIGKAHDTIINALMGLVLALGSYVLLYTINKSTVEFDALKLTYIPTSEIKGMEESDSIESGTARPFDITDPLWTYETFDCNSTPALTGVIDPSSTVDIPTIFPNTNTTSHLKNTGETVHPSLIPALEKINDVLISASEAEGVNYEIEVYSGYRSLQEQKDLWCGGCAKEHPDPQTRKKYCAVPGYSNHGLGIAIDVRLKKNGTQITWGGSKNQCDTNQLTDIEKLANFMYQSNPGWVRYEKEIWHFELNPSTANLRGKFTGFPDHCGK